MSDPAWYDEARKLRDAGMTRKAIAKALRRCLSSVGRALDESGYQIELSRAREHRREDRRRAARLREKAEAAAATDHPIAVFRLRGEPPRQVILQEAVMPAARLFAARKITLEELIARITP